LHQIITGIYDAYAFYFGLFFMKIDPNLLFNLGYDSNMHYSFFLLSIIGDLVFAMGYLLIIIGYNF
jgi:hypothetical protein